MEKYKERLEKTEVNIKITVKIISLVIAITVILLSLSGCQKEYAVSDEHYKIIYKGASYITLEMGAVAFECDELLGTASRETQDLLDYMFFGEMIYSVKGCNYSLIG